jgi:SAM-dependent methyltransferase
LDPALQAILRCPRCKAIASFTDNRAPRCERCGLDLHRTTGGVLDLLDVAITGEPTPPSTEQRFMESALVARIYDRVWRPTFVRMLAGKGPGAAIGTAGELFIHKQSLSLDDRHGPWLDLSCGPGVFCRSIGAAAPGQLVVGLDISRAMLEVAASRTAGYHNVQLIRADAHALPFADAAFEGVNNAGALHAYDDPEQVFREVLRVLKPGGLYVGSTFAEAPTLAGRLMARAAGIRRFEPLALRSWLGRIGFADYEELRLGGAFVFRARRP